MANTLRRLNVPSESDYRMFSGQIMIRDLKRTSTQINKQNRLDGGRKGQHDKEGKILYTKYINLFPRIKLESTLKRWPFDWIHKTHSHGISV